MRRKRRRGGRYRLLITMIILVAAAVVVFRLAAGRRGSSGGTEAVPDSTGQNTAAAAGNTADPIAVTAGSDAGSASGRTGAAETALAETAEPAAPASDEVAAGESAAAGAAVSSDASTQSSSEGISYVHVRSEIEKGRDYLDSLDQRSPSEMEYTIDLRRAEYAREKERKAYVDKREQYRRTLEEDGVWDQFEDYVLLGDSRFVGFDVFGYLPSERVLAEAGDTILAISDRMESVKELKPRYIFLSYGINDIGIGFWQTSEEYAKAFSEKIDELREENPDAQIFVNSIIPATDEAVDGVPVWGKIPEYSEALRQMCSEKGIPFIDNAELIEEHSDMYAGDGVHLQTEFYPYWAQNQLLGIYDLKNGRTSDGYMLGEQDTDSSEKDGK